MQRPAAAQGGAATERRWNLHGQATVIVHGHPGFPAAHSGRNSLQPGGEVRQTTSLDLMAGARLRKGAELYVDGLLWQGFGLSRTLGVAGFPNGEAVRVGTYPPNVNFARIFLRQTIGLGGDQQVVEDEALQLGGTRDVSRITVTAGRLSAKDLFDKNTYADDPRRQFMSWSLMANGAWDFPADTLGFTTGLALELNQPSWAARYGFFQVPRVVNGLALDLAVLKGWSQVAEVEGRYAIAGRPGALRLLAYLTQSHMGSYRAALAEPDRDAEIVRTQDYRHKAGFGLNLEQALGNDLGAFARLGWNDGRNQTWMFTDVDRTASVGVSVRGRRWFRPDDVFGLAGAINGISGPHRAFLAAGGLGITVGDGRLTYSPEAILETYYSARLSRYAWVSLDYQHIWNPAYNADRGPVHVFGVRFHGEF